MINLADVETCDDVVLGELERAEIDICRNKNKTGSYNVPCHIHGTLGGHMYVDPNDDFMNCWVYNKTTDIKMNSFFFTRWWNFWYVSGYVPLYISQEIYNNPKGGNNILARDATHPEEEGNNLPQENIACYKVAGMTVVRRHLIYTEESLAYFVETLEKYKLI